jgi:hypothetical protein
MRYFVGYGPVAFDTNWLLPDTPPAEGDVVFLVVWTKAGSVLAGFFIVGEMEECPGAPAIVPAAVFPVPELPVPPYLLPDSPRVLEPIAEGGRRLLPVDDSAGHALVRIAEEYLGKMKLPLLIGQKRIGEKRQKRQKSPEEHVKDIERKAKMRLGQADFREALVRVYGGRCAISECRVDAALSAAHILDYSQSECQDVWNGILLRADIHLLFDRHLLRIFPGNPPIVVLDPDISEAEAYKQFHLHQMRCPKPFDERTNEELRRRWEAANEAFRHFPVPPDGHG